MISISRSAGLITINGHANYAPHGQDIVCAAVSTLTQVFLASVEELCPDTIKSSLAAGKVVIRYGNLSEKAQTLLNSFFIGLEMIANEYPDNVQLSKH